MAAFIQGHRGAAVVSMLLIIQAALLWASFDAYPQISVFCTGPAESRVGLLFGLLHILLLGLLLVGVLSLTYVRLRMAYIVLLGAVLIMLPIQARLVSESVLGCDSP